MSLLVVYVSYKGRGGRGPRPGGSGPPPVTRRVGVSSPWFAASPPRGRRGSCLGVGERTYQTLGGRKKSQDHGSCLSHKRRRPLDRQTKGQTLSSLLVPPNTRQPRVTDEAHHPTRPRNDHNQRRREVTDPVPGTTYKNPTHFLTRSRTYRTLVSERTGPTPRPTPTTVSRVVSWTTGSGGTSVTCSVLTRDRGGVYPSGGMETVPYLPSTPDLRLERPTCPPWVQLQPRTFGF